MKKSELSIAEIDQKLGELHKKNAEPPDEPQKESKGKSGEPPKAAKADRADRADRFKMFNTFCDSAGIIHGLTAHDMVVWMILWRDTQKDGTACSAQAYIAKRCGCSSREVKRAIKRLKQCGLLSVIYQGGQNRGLSRYRVVV